MPGVRGLPRVFVPLLLAATMAAEEPARVVLVPVYTDQPLPGVNGSSWSTELWISNWGSEVAAIDGLAWDCFLPQCGAAPVAAGVSFPSAPSASDALHGTLLKLESSSIADSVGFSLRFRDLSRQSSTAGTEIPVPRDSDFRAGRFSLLNVPLADGFRQTLRIYELEGTEREALVRVRVWRPRAAFGRPNGEPDELLGDHTFALGFSPPDPLAAAKPGYAQITDLSTIAPLGDAESVRLEVEPVTEGLRLWAFVTVIHNETQHATVISP